MTQDILSEMESDEVNSISDTTEATDVAGMIRNSYEYIIDNMDIPFESKLFSLDSLSDSSKPTHMKFPGAMRLVEWIKYNKEDVTGEADYTTIPYCTPEAFLDLVYKRNETDSNTISVVDVGGAELLIRTDKHPEVWTTFDDEHVVFDSHKLSIDSILQVNKTSCWGSIEKPFNLQDDFVPDLPSKFFTLLYNESKAEAFANFKEGNRRAERKSRRQTIKLSHDGKRNKETGEYYAFGRR